MLAHLVIRKGRLAWSGYNASGDPAHSPYALIVDVGRAFILTSEGRLYLIGPGPMHFAEFSPDALAIAARNGLFGFAVMHDNEQPSRRRDRQDRARQSLGRRGRIAANQVVARNPSDESCCEPT